ncbi:DUF4249 domain-containing protein [Flagellimonas sp. S3867]|uniref:DUF4249 domain-containing protein n=1 Tax=Flagellimonas sp. S3867 TaxID=2768063 RepID=UPI001685A899|nr:DUF4249 domain-containing protein [Flagellimonas sp. S3867]
MTHSSLHIRKFATWVIWLVVVLLYGCTEPLFIDVSGSDSVLVVDATITNELKNHEILLSRSSQSDTEEPIPERSANLSVEVDNQQTYTFTEIAPGRYKSDMAFAAQSNNAYELRITTAEGKNYRSKSIQLPQATQIDNVYAELTQTDTGIDGVNINVDSFDPTGNSVYYRYKYEETYKVIAPEWRPWELVLANEDPPIATDALHTEEKRVCFATEKSNSIILTKTTDSSEDRITSFAVRFLAADNFIISHRYSILVRQFVLNEDTYEFYEQLNEFSESESIFSQIQPGFIIGNIFPEDGSDERVVGIFEVSSVSERRVFFNYVDFFPEEALPPFVDECRRSLATNSEVLGQAVKAQSVSLAGFLDNGDGSVTYIIQPRVCGDCTALGTNVEPDFWEE